MGGLDGSLMAAADKKHRPARRGKEPADRRGPEWTSGLKQLYDAVVDEPIPDAFKDLLSRLDNGTR